MLNLGLMMNYGIKCRMGASDPEDNDGV